MNRFLLLAFTLPLLAQDQAGGLLRHLSIATLKNSGPTTINAMKTDAEGNIYVAGTTSAFDLPVKNAAQPVSGERVLLRSTDRGLTWTPLQNSADSGDVLAFAAHPTNPSILFRGTAKGIEKTVDGGRTWRRTYQADSPPGDSFSIAIDPADPRKAYAAVDWRQDFFLVSNDGGESWLQRQRAFLSPDSTVSVDPTGSGAVVAGRFLSRDQGATWVEIRLPESRPEAAVFDPHRRGWIVAYANTGASGAIYLSTNWGADWKEISLPVRTGGFRPAVYSLVFDPDRLGAIHIFDVWGDRHLTTNDGATWSTTERAGIQPNAVALSRRCGGGGLFAANGSFFDFSDTELAQPLPRIVRIVVGPDCSLYARRALTSDAFAAKWSPDGRDLLWVTYLGGMEADNTTALALDAASNVYVGGTTLSPDFPLASPRAPNERAPSLFVSKLDADGRLLYTATAGTSSPMSPTALAVNEQGEAHVAGWTDSALFPTTSGAVGLTYPGPGAAFAVKFNSSGALVYSTYLASLGASTRLDSGSQIPILERRIAAAAGPDGTLFVGGSGGILVRVSTDGSSSTRLPFQPGRIIAMERGAGGEIYVAGMRLAGTRSTRCVSGTGYAGITIFRLESDVFVRKINSVDGTTEWQSDLSGPCASWPESMAVSPTGEVALGVYSFSTFPLVRPLLINGFCGGRIAARLGAEGGQLLQATSLDECTPNGPFVANSPDGGIYVGSNFRGNGILRIPKPERREIDIDRAIDALSGGVGRLAPGRMLFLSAPGVTGETVDVGLNNPGPLPLELGGVRVLMDEQPVGIFRVSPQGVICVVPPNLQGKQALRVAVMSVSGGSSGPVLIQVDTYWNISLLTKPFPEPPAPNVAVDLNVRNADGTLNSESNPAVIGSTVTFFATGVPQDRTVNLVWNPLPPQRSQLIRPVSAPAEPMPGFIENLWAIRFRIPDAVGPGVFTAPTPGVLTRAVINGFGIYVK